MTTLTIDDEVTLEQTERVLRDALPNYHIRRKTDTSLVVRRYPDIVIVRISQGEGSTTFKIAARGILLGFVINLWGLVPRVRDILANSFTSVAK